MADFKARLIAPCGINCGVCAFHLRSNKPCPGCRGADANKPVTRSQCKIKTCRLLKKQGSKFCYECREYPCGRLKHLDARYRTTYHMSTLENLEAIRDTGIRKFLQQENQRWTCPSCEGTMCVHTGSCFDCRTRLS